MNVDLRPSRRSLLRATMLLAAGHTAARAQGFAGLGGDAGGFAAVTPGRAFTFPADHGAHRDYRIEWWYVTANLTDATGVAWGVQWTLFRQALLPGPQASGWADTQVWMGHAAVTRADLHRSSERLARGGIGQAGVAASPLHAWIDAWDLRGDQNMSAMTVAPLQLTAAGENFSYDLRLDATQPLVLQGNAGYSRKSERGQASYYYSQPYFKATGAITLDNTTVQMTGNAWMDREWSSQPLASDQTGWDWFSLHLDGGDKLMLYRLRQTDGRHHLAGNWITAGGISQELDAPSITMTPTARSSVAGREMPTGWHIEIPTRKLAIETVALNPQSWMGTRFPYWEGPIRIGGSHGGVGYLEMTGY
jgi:predicted secreted hydrolase